MTKEFQRGIYPFGENNFFLEIAYSTIQETNYGKMISSRKLLFWWKIVSLQLTFSTIRNNQTWGK